MREEWRKTGREGCREGYREEGGRGGREGNYGVGAYHMEWLHNRESERSRVIG